MKLKVCGITTLAQLQMLVELAVDYAGLIFYEKSKRYAWGKLKAETSRIQNLQIKKIGVFVNADMGFLKSCIQDFGLKAVQLHGDESVEYCAAIQKEIEVIKVFRMNDQIKDVDALLEPYQNVSDYFLFDTDTEGYGGSGKRFDWNLLQTPAINKSFFLSGGIGSGDIDFLKSFEHPFFYAVDINSRFETEPGLKDMEKVQAFANALKQPLWTK
jgi:phosphoribosylanthranilate isomerase